MTRFPDGGRPINQPEATVHQTREDGQPSRNQRPRQQPVIEGPKSEEIGFKPRYFIKRIGAESLR